LARTRGRPRGRPRDRIVGGGSIDPFVQNIVLAARNEDLGTAVTTFLVRGEPEARALLHLPEGVAIASLLAMGHPAKRVTRLRRRPVEEFARIDAYDGPAFTA
jgi:nitroreductase